MRRLTLFGFLLPLSLQLFGCANDAAAAPADAADDETTEAPDAPPPAVSVTGSRVASPGTFVVTGKVENAKVPATFRLRTETGCARDVKLHTSTIGIGYSITLDGADLAAAFACAVDVEVGDDVLSPIAIAPVVQTSAASTGLSVDPAIATVAADLDPRTGHMIRFTVIADHLLESARVDLGGTTYRATLAPLDPSSDRETSALFEVPAGAWAEAVLAGAVGHVTTTDTSGRLRTIDVKPSVDVTLVGVDDDDDEGGC